MRGQGASSRAGAEKASWEIEYDAYLDVKESLLESISVVAWWGVSQLSFSLACE